MKKLFLSTGLILLSFFTSNAQYVQTFETTTLTTLVNDSGWIASGVSVGNSGKLTGAKELQTQLLNTSTATSTYLETYYYQGLGSNSLQFQHVINNASGKSIDLIITVLDQNNSVIGTPFTYTYANASARTDNHTFFTREKYRLRFEWSGAKVSSGSSAFLDMVFVSSSFIPLPVKLLNFSSEMLGDETVIKWTSVEEVNFSHYELYKSYNGAVYSKLADVAPNASGEGVNQYNYLDKTEVENVYYKIKMVDLDGQFTWTNTIKAKGNNTEINNLVFPIPAENVLNVQFNSQEIGEATITLTDAFGKVILSEKPGTIETGDLITLDVSMLNSGIYFVNILGGEALSKPIKFIKL
jgi:hypothetical protein